MVLYIDHTKYLLSCAYTTNGERSFHTQETVCMDVYESYLI